RRTRSRSTGSRPWCRRRDEPLASGGGRPPGGLGSRAAPAPVPRARARPATGTGAAPGPVPRPGAAPTSGARAPPEPWAPASAGARARAVHALVGDTLIHHSLVGHAPVDHRATRGPVVGLLVAGARVVRRGVELRADLLLQRGEAGRDVEARPLDPLQPQHPAYRLPHLLAGDLTRADGAGQAAVGVGHDVGARQQ